MTARDVLAALPALLLMVLGVVWGALCWDLGLWIGAGYWRSLLVAGGGGGG